MEFRCLRGDLLLSAPAPLLYALIKTLHVEADLVSDSARAAPATGSEREALDLPTRSQLQILHRTRALLLAVQVASALADHRVVLETVCSPIMP